MINFECPKCHASLAVEDTQAGHSAQCPQCSQVVVVPENPKTFQTMVSRVISEAKKDFPSNILPPADEKSRMWCALCHLGGLLPSVPMNIIIPLIFWLIKKDQLSEVDKHGKAAINFQLTCTAAYAIFILLFFIKIGYILLAAAVIFNFIVSLIAVIQTASSHEAKYPFLFRFIK